jgi:cholesterol transport system auxiliary component
VHYYTLSPASVPANQANPDGPTILVGLIATPESLQDDRIRFRAGANETGSYEYHRWEERPGAMVRDALVRALRASGKYRRVMESSSAALGDYLVRGKVYEFAEVDNPAIQTRISLHLELIDRKTNRSVWDRAFERQEPAGGKTIKEVVESMDRNLQQAAAAAAAEIDRFLSGRG